MRRLLYMTGYHPAHRRGPAPEHPPADGCRAMSAASVRRDLSNDTEALADRVSALEDALEEGRRPGGKTRRPSGGRADSAAPA